MVSSEECSKCNEIKAEVVGLRHFLSQWFSVLIDKFDEHDRRMEQSMVSVLHLLTANQGSPNTLPKLSKKQQAESCSNGNSGFNHYSDSRPSESGHRRTRDEEQSMGESSGGVGYGNGSNVNVSDRTMINGIASSNDGSGSTSADKNGFDWFGRAAGNSRIPMPNLLSAWNQKDRSEGNNHKESFPLASVLDLPTPPLVSPDLNHRHHHHSSSRRTSSRSGGTGVPSSSSNCSNTMPPNPRSYFPNEQLAAAMATLFPLAPIHSAPSVGSIFGSPCQAVAAASILLRQSANLISATSPSESGSDCNLREALLNGHGYGGGAATDYGNRSKMSTSGNGCRKRTSSGMVRDGYDGNDCAQPACKSPAGSVGSGCGGLSANSVAAANLLLNSRQQAAHAASLSRQGVLPLSSPLGSESNSMNSANHSEYNGKTQKSEKNSPKFCGSESSTTSFSGKNLPSRNSPVRNSSVDGMNANSGDNSNNNKSSSNNNNGWANINDHHNFGSVLSSMLVPDWTGRITGAGSFSELCGAKLPSTDAATTAAFEGFLKEHLLSRLLANNRFAASLAYGNSGRLPPPTSNGFANNSSFPPFLDEDGCPSSVKAAAHLFNLTKPSALSSTPASKNSSSTADIANNDWASFSPSAAVLPNSGNDIVDAVVASVTRISPLGADGRRGCAKLGTSHDGASSRSGTAGGGRSGGKGGNSSQKRESVWAKYVSDDNQCLICNASFTIRTNAKRHVKLHIVGKPLVCSQCDQRFARKHSLEEHMKKTHSAAALAANASADVASPALPSSGLEDAELSAMDTTGSLMGDDCSLLSNADGEGDTGFSETPIPSIEEELDACSVLEGCLDLSGYSSLQMQKGVKLELGEGSFVGSHLEEADGLGDAVLSSQEFGSFEHGDVLPSRTGGSLNGFDVNGGISKNISKGEINDVANLSGSLNLKRSGGRSCGTKRFVGVKKKRKTPMPNRFSSEFGKFISLNNQCLFCDKQFTERGNALRHVKLHMNGRQHVCRECGKAFGRKDVMETHLKGVHGIVLSGNEELNNTPCDDVSVTSNEVIPPPINCNVLPLERIKSDPVVMVSRLEYCESEANSVKDDCGLGPSQSQELTEGEEAEEAGKSSERSTGE